MIRKTMIPCLLSLASLLGCAQDALDDAGDEVNEPAAPALSSHTAALTEGDHTVRCSPADVGPDDALACESKSGSKIFEQGECKLEVKRTCGLRNVQGHLRCCCRFEVERAKPACDGVTWADILGG